MSIEQPSMSEQNFDIEKKAQELLEETDSENRTRTYHGVFPKSFNCLSRGLVHFSALLQYHRRYVHYPLSFVAYSIPFVLHVCLLSGIQKRKTRTKVAQYCGSSVDCSDYFCLPLCRYTI